MQVRAANQALAAAIRPPGRRAAPSPTIAAIADSNLGERIARPEQAKAKRAAPSSETGQSEVAPSPPPKPQPASSQPPVPSRAAVRAAQQQMSDHLSQGMKAGSQSSAPVPKPVAKTSQPPVPSRAAVQAAQQSFAGTMAAQQKAGVKSSQPPVPSRAAVSAAQQKFASIMGAGPAASSSASTTSAPLGALTLPENNQLWEVMSICNRRNT